jgi:hypothetical protein
VFERRLASAEESERDALLAGSAGAVRSLLLGEVVEASAFDTSFAVLHGLYWLTVNRAGRRPLQIAVDDAHWTDEPSLRWLAHLAPRLEGAAVALLVALRAAPPASMGAWLEALLDDAQTMVREIAQELYVTLKTLEATSRARTPSSGSRVAASCQGCSR